MGKKPRGKTLERIDNEKGYSKDNCKWATKHEQACNRRNTLMITFNGKTQTMTDWAREYGLIKGRIVAENLQYKMGFAGGSRTACNEKAEA